MKMKSAPKGKAIKAPPTRKMSAKPHIRMQKLKPVPASAFPTAAAAFPTSAAPPGPDAAAAAAPEGMPSGAAPGMMGE